MASTGVDRDELEESWSDTWSRRFESTQAVLPYVLLALATAAAGLSLTQGYGATSDFTGTLGFVGLAAVWILWWQTLHPGWAERRGLMTVFFLGRLAVTAVLVLRNGLFGIFAFTNYIDALRLFPIGWGLAAICANALLMATSQLGGLPAPNVGAVLIYVVLILLNMSLASLFGFSGYLVSRQSEQRRHSLGELADANQKLTETMRENAGLHAQLLTQAREAGIFDERQRMAREIHDTLAQGLTGIIAQLQAAEQARSRHAEWGRHLDNASRLARESLAEARRSVHAMSPRALDSAHLPTAIAEVVNAWSEISGVESSLTTTGTPRTLHPEIEVALLRAAQEALANVAKHADANRVGLTLSYMEDVVTLDVRDDGVGFDPAADVAPRQDGGFGLTAMRQRLSRVGGGLEVESEPGGGTAISANVPAIAPEGSGE